MDKSSRLGGFYKLSPQERIDTLQEFADLTQEEAKALSGVAGLGLTQADHMIENVVGVFGLPLGIATNFLINGRDYLIPMAIEEPSVVAGASFAARLVRDGGGFKTSSDEPWMIGQIQVLDVGDPWAARFELLAAKERILSLANEQDPVIVKLGGGAKDLEVRIVEHSPSGPMLIVHLIYDARDAMGANTVNTAVEAVAPLVAGISGGRTLLRIISNLADRRLARAKGMIPVSSLAHGEFSGEQVAKGIVEAWAFAAADPYRAATHNKGIMNGIDAVVIATGNDWRAIEAGAHSYAARSGRYTSLSTWQLDTDGHLIGTLELPMAVGIIGGATRVHPAAKAALRLLGVKTARELAEIIAAVGLAQNLAALRALASEGIQRGHMKLHARQVAIAAGAEGEMIDRVVQAMLDEKVIRLDKAEAILNQLRAES
ncbi:MAG: 3-hydroxy-3-methylglutaryl-CoA reductase [Anaerolineae bacterium SM23_84]|nr:MAG: 3-hydroxy-3-methylglutaryl-CoA reductase [Anaerolineae bacterium SM23_84]